MKPGFFLYFSFLFAQLVETGLLAPYAQDLKLSKVLILLAIKKTLALPRIANNEMILAIAKQADLILAIADYPLAITH